MDALAGKLSLLISIGLLTTAIYQLLRQNKIANMKNHIELRKMFSEENKIIVHGNLRPGGKRYRNGIGPKSQKDRVMVDDYLGLFETCEEMLNNNLLKKDLFKSSYLYRLQNIVNNKIIMKEKINGEEKDYRKLFKNLLKRYNLDK